MSTQQDLWGELDEETLDDGNPVVELLNDQAKLLSAKTGDRIQAKVETVAAGGQALFVRFIVVAPRLDGFRYELFKVLQPKLDFPVNILLGDTEKECSTAAEYEEAIRTILQSDATRKVIANLRAAERNALDL